MPPSDKCQLHDVLANEISELRREIKEFIKDERDQEKNVASRLSVVETKLMNLVSIVMVCGVVIVGRIVYDIVAGS